MYNVIINNSVKSGFIGVKVMLKEKLKKGIVLNTTKRISYFMLFLLFAGMFSITTANAYVPAQNLSIQVPAEIANKKHKTSADKLYIIDKYQEKYFEIITRNDVLLKDEDVKELNIDRTELNRLFAEVQNQVKNKKYLKKYNKIQKRYAKCDEITTTGINKCAEKNYNAVDSLLNEVFKKVKSKISSKDYKYLTLSEKEWQKRVDDYQKNFDAMGFGTIGASIYNSYQINMKEFRTLLLMLYW